MEALKMNNKYDRQHIKTSYKVKLTCTNLAEARPDVKLDMLPGAVRIVYIYLCLALWRQ